MVKPQRLVVAVTAVFLFSCGPTTINLTENEGANQYCQLPAMVDPDTPSDTLKVALQVDGSGSMLGYVNDDSSNYAEALRLLDEAIVPSEAVELEYYRVGRSSQASEGRQSLSRQDYRKAQIPEFYNGNDNRFPSVYSSIDAAIVPPDRPNTLQVIVTDLEQDGGDVTQLIRQIQTHYFNENNKNAAVGIWAFKSEFTGDVYLQGQQKIQNIFAYSTEGKSPQEWRPAYVLFIGPYQDIAYYFDKLNRSSSKALENSQFTIFSPTYIVSEIAHFQNLPEADKLPDDVYRPVSLSNGKVAVEAQTPPYELLEILSNRQESFELDYAVPFAASDYTLPFNPSALKTATSIRSFDSFQDTFNDISDSQLGNALSLNNWQRSEEQFQFKTTVNPDAFSESNIYLFTIDVLASELEEPSWWQEWDRGSRENEEDGSKTHNIYPFLRQLKNTTTDLMVSGGNQPLVGRFCYAIQKN